MGEYGPGLTAGRAFSLDKERIKHALKGELLAGETEEGFYYKPASREECEKFILGSYDNVVFHCLEAYAFGRIYEHYLEKNGIRLSLSEILISKAIEDMKDQDYQYEGEEDGE